jgi:hypothetical protein
MNPESGWPPNAHRQQTTSGGTVNIRKSTKAPLALVLALTAGIGLSACSAGDSGSTGTSPAAASSSTVENPKPAAVVRAIPGGTTEVALDADFVAALGTLGLTPGIVGGATLTDGTLGFPITGGTVTLYDKDSGYRPWVQGVILHEGSGFSLTAGGTTVELTNFTVDPGKPARLFGDVTVNGELAVPSAPLFNLDGSTLEPLSMDADGSAVLQGTGVKLSDEAAALLNQTFGTDALAGGLLIGIATITVQTA